MPKYNLIEYIQNYSRTFGTLWNYYKDIPIDSIANFDLLNTKINVTGKTVNDGNTK